MNGPEKDWRVLRNLGKDSVIHGATIPSCDTGQRALFFGDVGQRTLEATASWASVGAGLTAGISGSTGVNPGMRRAQRKIA